MPLSRWDQIAMARSETVNHKGSQVWRAYQEREALKGNKLLVAKYIPWEQDVYLWDAYKGWDSSSQVQDLGVK